MRCSPVLGDLVVADGSVELLLSTGHFLRSSQVVMAEIVRVANMVGLHPAVRVEAPSVLEKPAC